MMPEAALARCETILAHAWMIRTFLKHAEEIQASAEMLEVPRTLYDCIRAVEPAKERGDVGEYLRRLKGKLSKLRRVAKFFDAEYKHYSPHTNYVMAAQSLSGVVAELEAVFAEVVIPPSLPRERDPLEDLDIPDV
ncbi:MAG: hypothetical protein ACRCZF_18945 [Gemmataceae bacterium]